MNDLQLELTRLIGKKELTFGCLLDDGEGSQAIYLGKSKEFPNAVWKIKKQEYGANNYMHRDIIGHPATLSDFHRWMNENNQRFGQEKSYIRIYRNSPVNYHLSIPYDSSKDLLPAYEGAPCQSEETLKQIVELIKSNQ